MALIGVAEAAKRLGVSVSRVHQRIVDGSLPATRIGAQWVIDEAVLPAVAESTPGRPLSRRSAWALVAVSQGDGDAVARLAPTEIARARTRLGRLLALASAADTEPEARAESVAKLLRAWMRARSHRRPFRASPRDLSDLRRDPRVALGGASHPSSGIAAGDLVEGYVSFDHLPAVVEDYLLSPARTPGEAPNVVLHVTEPGQPVAVGPLLVAADLAEHRGPREQARSVELLRELAYKHPDLVETAR